MKYSKDIFMISTILILAVSVPLAIGQLAELADIDVKDTVSTTDHRKPFGYCPVDDDTTTVLTKYGVQYEIEGCPLSRVYVDNWNKLDAGTQQAIVNELASKGYRMEKE